MLNACAFRFTGLIFNNFESRKKPSPPNPQLQSISTYAKGCAELAKPVKLNMASPPHVPQLNIPRKRGSISSATGAQAKKRKPSQLRNAFSPDTEAVGSPRQYSRSPSVDSVATGSVANGAGGRKRKRKDGDTQSVTGSMRGGKARSAITGIEGEGADGAEGKEDEEEEDEGQDDELDALLEGEGATEESKKQEKEHERLLVEAMNETQEQRYETYRRIRLKRETLRKLVNQTLSQSVPPNIIIAVTSYSKAFLGELIDRALTVRDEWAAVRTHVPNINLPPNLLRLGFNNPSGHRAGTMPTSQEIQSSGLYYNQVRGETLLKEVEKDTPLAERLNEMDKGPLTPAHLREALRRYKRDREGGGAGVAGMSLEGVERTMGRTGGRRLFR